MADGWLCFILCGLCYIVWVVLFCVGYVILLCYIVWVMCVICEALGLYFIVCALIVSGWCCCSRLLSCFHWIVLLIGFVFNEYLNNTNIMFQDASRKWYRLRNQWPIINSWIIYPLSGRKLEYIANNVGTVVCHRADYSDMALTVGIYAHWIPRKALAMELEC